MITRLRKLFHIPTRLSDEVLIEVILKSITDLGSAVNQKVLSFRFPLDGSKPKTRHQIATDLGKSAQDVVKMENWALKILKRKLRSSGVFDRFWTCPHCHRYFELHGDQGYVPAIPENVANLPLKTVIIHILQKQGITTTEALIAKLEEGKAGCDSYITGIGSHNDQHYQAVIEVLDHYGMLDAKDYFFYRLPEPRYRDS